MSEATLGIIDVSNAKFSCKASNKMRAKRATIAALSAATAVRPTPRQSSPPRKAAETGIAKWIPGEVALGPLSGQSQPVRTGDAPDCCLQSHLISRREHQSFAPIPPPHPVARARLPAPGVRAQPTFGRDGQLRA